MKAIALLFALSLSAGHAYADAAKCVSQLKKVHKNWGANVLEFACEGNSMNCSAKLANIKPEWSAMELVDACSTAEPRCVHDTAMTTALEANDINSACR